MNELIQFAGTDWAEAWVVTLIHSLWQGALILGLVYMVMWLFDIHQPRYRYFAGITGMIVFMLLVVTTFVIFMPENQPLTETQGASHLTLTKMIDARLTEATRSNTLITFIDEHLSIILTTWLSGVILLMLRIIGGYQYMNKIIQKSASDVPQEWLNKLQSIRSHLGISREIRVVHTRLMDMPVVFGHIKPVLLLPVSILSGLTTQQLEAVFAHELAHIRRHDYVVNIVQHLLEALFFFNPFLWLISDILRKEREKCCDDLAVEYCKDRTIYVRALSSMENYRSVNNLAAMGLAGHRGQLIDRIKRLLEPDYGRVGSSRWVMMIVLTITLFTFSYFTHRPAEILKKEAVKAGTPILIPKECKILPLIHLQATDTTGETEMAEMTEEEQQELEDSIDEMMEDIDISEFPDEWFSSPQVFNYNVQIPESFNYQFSDSLNIALVPLADMDFDLDLVVPEMPINTFYFRMDTVPDIKYDTLSLTDEQREELRKARETMEEYRDKMSQMREEQRERVRDIRDAQRDLQQAKEEKMRDLMEQQRSIQEEKNDQMRDLMEQQQELQRESQEEVRAWMDEHREELRQAQRELADKQRVYVGSNQRAFNGTQIHVSDALRKSDDALRKAQSALVSVSSNSNGNIFSRQSFEDVIEDMLRQDEYLSDKQDLKKIKVSEDSFSYNGKTVKDKDLDRYLQIVRAHFGDLDDARIEIKVD